MPLIKNDKDNIIINTYIKPNLHFCSPLNFPPPTPPISNHLVAFRNKIVIFMINCSFNPIITHACKQVNTRENRSYFSNPVSKNQIILLAILCRIFGFFSSSFDEGTRPLLDACPFISGFSGWPFILKALSFTITLSLIQTSPWSTQTIALLSFTNVTKLPVRMQRILSGY